jgi:NADPH2:quinone reductase
MRAIVVSRPGGPEVLTPRDVPRPEPGLGDVRVRVRAFGVNRADLLQRRGVYPAPADAPQEIPGLEFAGEVDALGADVTAPPVGTRVMAIVGGGAYAEHLTVPAEHLLEIPAALSFTEAAAVPEVFVTAFDALERLDVRADEWVLVHAVGSGVGTAAVQLIRARGSRSIGTSRSPWKLTRARELGLDGGVDTTTEDLVTAVHRFTPSGADAAIDLIGGPLFPATLAALRPRGRLILVGLTAGRQVEVDLGVILRNRLHVEGTVLRARAREEKTRLAAAFRAAVLPLLSAGTVRPVVDRVFPLTEVAEAHAYMESDANLGKIVVEIP